MSRETNAAKNTKRPRLKTTRRSRRVKKKKVKSFTYPTIRAVALNLIVYLRPFCCLPCWFVFVYGFFSVVCSSPPWAEYHKHFVRLRVKISAKFRWFDPVSALVLKIESLIESSSRRFPVIKRSVFVILSSWILKSKERKKPVNRFHVSK